MPKSFQVSFTTRTLTVSGKLTSDQAADLRRDLFAFTFKAGGQLKLDFTRCAVFSTTCVPALMEFIKAAKAAKMTVTIMAGSALRRTFVIAAVNIGIKRLDQED
jgi:ABC-type transporter Mla MlaB component